MSNIEAIRAAHARAMRARLRDEPMTGSEVERRDNPVWRLRLCDWCGAEYTAPLVRFGKNPGKSRQYCSETCRENALAASREISNRRPERLVKDKLAKRSARISARLDEKFQRVKQRIGEEWFTVPEASRVWQVTHENARATLDRLLERGSVRRRKQMGGVGGGTGIRWEWCCK